MWGISWLAENRLASQEGLCYMVEVSNPCSPNVSSWNSIIAFRRNQMITETPLKFFPVHWHCGRNVATFFNAFSCPCRFIAPYMTAMSVTRGHKYTSPSFWEEFISPELSAATAVCVLRAFWWRISSILLFMFGFYVKLVLLQSHVQYLKHVINRTYVELFKASRITLRTVLC